MNTEAGRLEGQKYHRLMKWVTVAGDWMIPVLLATVMAGQIFFSAANFYLGIEHPAWLFWGLLAAGVLLCIPRAMSAFRATRADMAMLAFVFLLTVSLLFSGLGEYPRAFLYIGAFMLLPYLAGRLLDETGISRFIVAMLCIAFLVAPLIGFGLLTMPESELRVDRISTLFAVRDTINMVGVSTIPHASMGLGLLLVLLTSILSTPAIIKSAALQFSLIAFMCCAAWLLIFVGLRGAILSALLVGFVSLVFGYGSILRRIALLLILFLAVAVSWMTLPSERKDHFNQVGSIQKDAGPICQVYGDSVATRMRLYDSALALFLESRWLGAGAGNYGFKGRCMFNEAFMSPHSILLQVLAELGLMGAIVYLTLVGVTLYELVQIVRRDTGQQQRLAWRLASIWLFFFLLDQISGNYFTGFHFFAATGLISGLVAAKENHRIRLDPHDGR